MKTFVSSGETVTLTAPLGGVTVDVPVQIGQLLVIPTVTALVGVTFVGMVRGIVSVTKVGSQAWAEGAMVYWDAGNTRFTTVAAGNHLAGYAVEVIGSGSTETTGTILLDGVARDDEST